jgi:hypothetical protein
MIRPPAGPLVLCALAALLLLLPAGAAAQEDAPPDTVPVEVRVPVAIPDDEVVEPPPPVLVTTPAGVYLDTVQVGISPRTAFLRSVVIPGWGQSSLGAPGRGGVYFALEAGSLWMVYKTGRKLREANREQQVLRETGMIAMDQRTPLVRDRRAQREDWITLSVFWLFFSGADAFVAAHLQDFEERIDVRPTPEGGFQLRATVPVGGPR